MTNSSSENRIAAEAAAWLASQGISVQWTQCEHGRRLIDCAEPWHEDSCSSRYPKR
jgi:hypothetical protein